MKVIIGGKEIALKNKEVIIARKSLNLFIDTVRRGSAKMNCPSLYFTYLIIMYKKSQELLEALSPDSLQIIMDLLTAMPGDGNGTNGAEAFPDA